MKKKKKRWGIAIAAVACLLAAVLILGTCGEGTLTEKEVPTSFGSAQYYRAEVAHYEVHAGVKTVQARIVLATPWGVLIRFTAPEGYYIKGYREGENDKEYFGLDKTDKFVFLEPGETLRFFVSCGSIMDLNTIYEYTYMP